MVSFKINALNKTGYDIGERFVKKYVGEIFKTKNYGELLITKWVSCNEVCVRFIATGYETKVRMSDIKKGMVRDRYVPSVCGVGIIGDGITRVKGVDVREYVLWRNMLHRCYTDKYQDNFPTYKGCTVSDNFIHYEYFKSWCNNQSGFKQEGWVLDKDILVKGNKVYGENTCCFVPHEINNLLVKSDSRRSNLPIGVTFNESTNKYTANYSLNGRSKRIGNYETVLEAFEAYKRVKETYIRTVTEGWKHLIDQRTYEALMNYQVEVTD